MAHLSRLRRHVVAVCAVFLVSLPACESDVVDNYGPVASLELLPTLWTNPTAVSDITANAFTVTSVIPFPCAPYALVPRAVASGATLTLRIEGRYQDGCPQDVTGLHSYRAEVVNVPTGTFQLRVVHAHREWARPADTVFVGAIIIP